MEWKKFFKFNLWSGILAVLFFFFFLSVLTESVRGISGTLLEFVLLLVLASSLCSYILASIIYYDVSKLYNLFKVLKKNSDVFSFRQYFLTSFLSALPIFVLVFLGNFLEFEFEILNGFSDAMIFILLIFPFVFISSFKFRNDIHYKSKILVNSILTGVALSVLIFLTSFIDLITSEGLFWENLLTYLIFTPILAIAVGLMGLVISVVFVFYKDIKNIKNHLFLALHIIPIGIWIFFERTHYNTYTSEILHILKSDLNAVELIYLRLFFIAILVLSLLLGYYKAERTG